MTYTVWLPKLIIAFKPEIETIIENPEEESEQTETEGDDEEITKRGCKRFVEKKLHLKKNTVDLLKENKKKFKKIFKKTYAYLQEEPEDEAKRQEESSVEQVKTIFSHDQFDIFLLNFEISETKFLEPTIFFGFLMQKIYFLS